MGYQWESFKRDHKRAAREWWVLARGFCLWWFVWLLMGVLASLLGPQL